MRTRKKLTDSLDLLVEALCLDYSRRARHIGANSVSKRTETEYKYLNFKIFDAAVSVCGERDALTYIEEIGNRVGYAKSKTLHSEVTYKKYKAMIKHNIALMLHLKD